MIHQKSPDNSASAIEPRAHSSNDGKEFVIKMLADTEHLNQDIKLNLNAHKTIFKYA